MYGPCYYPCQTRPSTALVGLLGYRVGSLLHTYGSYSFLSVDVRQSDPSKSHMQSTATNQAGLMVARVGLGVFEAGFGPGIPLYFCRHPLLAPSYVY